MAFRGQNSQGSIVSGSAIIAAGIASALAAAVTSSMGWAGGLIGAALTTMIVTGGSAILNAYLQSVKSRVQAAPGSIRAAAQRARPQGSRVDVPPRDPRAGEGFVDRLRAALGWFSRIPDYQRRSILKRGLIAAAVAFMIGVLAITAIEYGIGNSLSCGIWSNCPATSAPGLGGGGAYSPNGARSGYTLLAGHSLGGGVSSQTSPYEQQSGGGLFGGSGQQVPSQPSQQSGGGLFGGGAQQPAQPSQGGGGVFGGGNQQPVPQQPVPQQPVPQQPVPQQPTPAAPAQPEAPAVPQQGSGG